MRPVLFAAACSIAAWAQDAPPAVIQIGREVVKEGRAAAHEKVESDWARAMRRAKIPYPYLALNAMTGPGEVWFVTAFPSFAAVEEILKEFDKPPLKTEMDTLDSRDGEHRASSRTMYAVLLKDLSYQPEKSNIGKARFFSITTMHVRLGHMSEFMANGKAVVEAYRKSEQPVSYAAYQVLAGAPGGLFLFLEPMESLKAWDERPSRFEALHKALGTETFNRMMKGEGDVFVSTETTLFSVNPRMSYVSKATEDADPGFWRPKPETKPKEPRP